MSILTEMNINHTINQTINQTNMENNLGSQVLGFCDRIFF